MGFVPAWRRRPGVPSFGGAGPKDASNFPPEVIVPPGAPNRRDVATIVTMKHRRDFLAVVRGRAARRFGVVVQGRQRAKGGVVRVGYTATRKVGGSVVRNRAKRRLRAAAAIVLPGLGRPGWDYVLIARRSRTVVQPFQALVADTKQALQTIHGGKPA